MFENTQGIPEANYGTSGVDDYLDSMFSMGTRSNTRSSQSSTSEETSSFNSPASLTFRADWGFFATLGLPNGFEAVLTNEQGAVEPLECAGRRYYRFQYHSQV